MGLEELEGLRVLDEKDIAALLKIPDVNKAVDNSLLYSLGILAQRVGNYKLGKSETPSDYAVNIMSESFVKNLFPYFKKLHSQDYLSNSDSRVLALARFWSDIIGVVGFNNGVRILGALETYKLERDNGAPAVFLGQVLRESTFAGRDEAVKRYLYPIKLELSNTNFDGSIAKEWR